MTAARALVAYSSCGVNFTLRGSCALSATTIVEADISAAPMAGLNVNPAQASTPAASGMAITLYPAAQAKLGSSCGTTRATAG